MRKLILKILLFVVILLIPLCVADYFKTKEYRSKDYYPFSTWNDIVDGKLNSDTWILGSSRAWVQYNPRILDSILDISSYNLGCNAEFINPEIQCFEIARAYNKRPKYVLVDLFCHSMTMDLTPRCKFYYTPYIYKRKLRNIIRNNDNISWEYLYIPYYRYSECSGGEVYFTECKTYPKKGYAPNDIVWDGSELDKTDSVFYNAESEAIAYLDKFIKKEQNDSVTVILIHSPFYREGFEKIQNHQEMMTMFKNIADRHHIPFLDYTNDPICYDTAYFYNAMHLNARGADIFTAKLAHDLDSLNIIPARK
jgi:hypothetical protein